MYDQWLQYLNSTHCYSPPPITLPTPAHTPINPHPHSSTLIPTPITPLPRHTPTRMQLAVMESRCRNAVMDKEQLEEHLLDLEKEKKSNERKSSQVMNGPFQNGHWMQSSLLNNESATVVTRQP